ncbi:hypothetical protein ACO0LD_31280 [Undibacterium sp. Ji83W]|uniref:hypothetical protein n=1 Tax=Undibacterium sp. Ji83W TaxID=3413043 RepID=UPI003BF2F44E
MITEKISTLSSSHRSLCLLILISVLLPMWAACSYTAEEETINVTPWLRQRKQAKESLIKYPSIDLETLI